MNAVRDLLGCLDYQLTLRHARLAPEHKAAAVATLVAEPNGDSGNASNS